MSCWTGFCPVGRSKHSSETPSPGSSFIHLFMLVLVTRPNLRSSAQAQPNWISKDAPEAASRIYNSLLGQMFPWKQKPYTRKVLPNVLSLAIFSHEGWSFFKFLPPSKCHNVETVPLYPIQARPFILQYIAVTTDILKTWSEPRCWSIVIRRSFTP